MTNDARVLFLEVNEADRHFLERLVRRGNLPAFARAIDEGVLLNTRVPGWDAKRDRAWRDISPWIVWPSVYTGLLPSEHGIIGFGQDTSTLRDRCVWDVLDANGVSTGVFGSLMSYPPRNHGACAFYVPEALADTADCFPPAARPVQEFNVLAARNYSEGFGWKGVTAFTKLLQSVSVGVRPSTIARAVWQVPAEKLRGAHQEPERAMLASYIGAEAFRRLYRTHRPRFATLHMNHVAYMQHRYWRAAEPDRFADELSETDRRFFRSVDERRDYERKFAHWIDRSFEYTDAILGETMDEVPDGTWILFGTALGQRPLDPCGQIHNPVVRLVRERELFAAIGLPPHRVQHQMNPDVTVDLADEAAAREGERIVGGLFVHEGEPLFEVQRRGRQLFLELNVPRRRDGAAWPPIRHADRPGWSVPAERHVAEHWNNDQSTAHHKDVGLLLAWRKGSRVTSPLTSIDVTDIAPNILRLFGLPPAPWHRPRNPEAFVSTAR